ncbi:hypothetical protein SAMN05428988_0377 [Chitinophaga sp. YR573]|uniref:hypothetical protein n=1 Tax=Chitinophaga sp. YR573 TaxID=1881040 RepID=UPI0008CAA61A|nr:hypothetical protein [Chitinophaga sp. YR573]SEV91216.1 hypothetical protein SAMN05428988_0377 [Chitinophaga sp. YR573]
MSSSVTTLTSIVYHLCNVEEDNLRDKKQYEAQKAALLAEIHTIREAIVINALSIVNQQKYKQFIAHKYRTLTVLESLLEEAISKKESEYSFTTQLMKEVLSHTGVLNYFVQYHFSPTLDSQPAPSQHITTIEKIKLDVTAGGIAVLTKALMKAALNITPKVQDEIVSYIVTHFNSRRTDDLAITTFKKNYRNPEPAAIEDAIGFLTRMIDHLRNL